MEWTDHAEQLFLDGERERDRVELDSAVVVVTTHRVLVFTPERDGTDFRTVDRPNVRNVTVETDSNWRSARWALTAGVLGGGLLAAGLLVDAAGVVATLSGERAGPASGAVDGLLAAVESLLTAFEFTLLGTGFVVLLVGLLFALQYARSRSRRLILWIADDENVDLSVSDGDLERGVVPALTGAIGPEATSMDGSTDGDDRTAEPDGTLDPANSRSQEDGG